MSINAIGTAMGTPQALDTTRAYVAQRGDTLGSIAQRMGVPAAELAAANPGILNPDHLYPGQVLHLPPIIERPANPFPRDPAPAPGIPHCWPLPEPQSPGRPHIEPLPWPQPRIPGMPHCWPLPEPRTPTRPHREPLPWPQPRTPGFPHCWPFPEPRTPSWPPAEPLPLPHRLPQPPGRPRVQPLPLPHPFPDPGPVDNGKPPFDPDQPPLTLKDATRILLAHYSDVAGKSWIDNLLGAHGKITVFDLQRIANSTDPSVPQDLKQAARLLLESPVGRHFLDVGAGKGSVDGVISRQDLEAALRSEDSPLFAYLLLDTAAGIGGRDGVVSDKDLAAALKDPGVPPEIRKQIVAQLSDQQLLRIIGQPTLDPSLSPADRRKVLATFVALARVSPLGASEAEQLVAYHTQLGVHDGHGESDTINNTIKLDHGVLYGDPKYAVETLAHEGGHAIFDKSGLQAKVEAMEKSGALPPGMSGIINEAFAGAYGNRVHLTEYGVRPGNAGDQAALKHLSLLADVMDNISSNAGFYAKHYGLDTAKARQHIGDIKDALRLLAPYLQSHFPIGDGQLAAGL